MNSYLSKGIRVKKQTKRPQLKFELCTPNTISPLTHTRTLESLYKIPGILKNTIFKMK